MLVDTQSRKQNMPGTWSCDRSTWIGRAVARLVQIGGISRRKAQAREALNWLLMWSSS